MPNTIFPLNKTINVSRFSLDAAAFDIVNFRSAGAPANSTLNADTPKGVLGGSVATVGNADWESDQGVFDSAMLLGLYSDQSEGNAFENAPAAASGVVAIYMSGGLFEVFVFETNDGDTPYASILGSYTLGAPLYASYFGLLTPQVPSTMDTGGGVDTIIARVTRVPTSSDLKLGIKLVL